MAVEHLHAEDLSRWEFGRDRDSEIGGCRRALELFFGLQLVTLAFWSLKSDEGAYSICEDADGAQGEQSKSRELGETHCVE